MKLKSFAVISGRILSTSQRFMTIAPDFDPSARISVLYPDKTRDAEKYRMLQADDEIIVYGEIALYDARRVNMIPTEIHRQVKGGHRTVNLVQLTARAKSVEYSLHTDDLFKAEFESGILSITRVNFRIDRNRLDPEQLRDFALGNQYRPYTISGGLGKFDAKLQLIACSITRA